MDERAPSAATRVPSKALRTVSAHDGGCFTCSFDRCNLLTVQHKRNTFLCHLLCNECSFRDSAWSYTSCNASSQYRTMERTFR